MRRVMLPNLFENRKNLGSLEDKVMQIVWQRKETTVRQALAALGAGNLRAYTTVMTVLDNLYEKGFVERVRVKKAFHYRAAAPRNLLVGLSLNKLMQDLIFEHGQLAVLRPLAKALIPSRLGLTTWQIGDRLAVYKTPFVVGFTSFLGLGFLVISFWDIVQSLIFSNSLDYLKLVLTEPVIIVEHTKLILSAFLESLPVVSLTVNLTFLALAGLILRRAIKMGDFKFPLSLRTGGLV